MFLAKSPSNKPILIYLKIQFSRKWRNGGIINPFFDGLAYNTSGNFAYCSYFSSPLQGSEKYYATRKISTRIICETIE